ncbi:hypothetical protein CLV99_0969 [Sphingobacterium yanglingense]|uniref:Uncharacterized protein n=1 Tax=Sphingobacterium yanglingense TaxID=1437280 RepID=A0A4R6WKR3_9SPHI|nr:hypothetical protein CLV99_0969 [Sphingobacterium yanglingense]
MWLILFLIVMFSAKAYVTYLIFKILFKPKKVPFSDRRAQSERRKQFRTYSEYKKCKESERVEKLNEEIKNILTDRETKIYHTL